MEDVWVIRTGGPNAAPVRVRARTRVPLADPGAPRNAPAPQVYGRLSRDGTPPAELLATGRDVLMAIERLEQMR
ncbi:hypothetical protein [Streptomyces decoyicus]|uniref:hypothetical protein n=1 Tax=Streptomyces decoyicus TaxID=249567 RepID=UPI0004AAB85A|nr:hypothetical protein [Streptomyces decoyicus]KOG38321.1 hypothetical protein ADK74_33450 [Streptomyces decoyicus]QZY17525.1 hypothetical protein K7C20_21645 [Streptomyces decoyicus]